MGPHVESLVLSLGHYCAAVEFGQQGNSLAVGYAHSWSNLPPSPSQCNQPLPYTWPSWGAPCPPPYYDGLKLPESDPK